MTEISDFATLQPMAKGFEATVPVVEIWKQAFEMIERTPGRAALLRRFTGHDVNDFREERHGDLVNDATCAALARLMQDGGLALYVFDGFKWFLIPSDSAADVQWALGLLGADSGNLLHWVGAGRLPLMTTISKAATATAQIADLISGREPNHPAAALDPLLPVAFNRMRSSRRSLTKHGLAKSLWDADAGTPKRRPTQGAWASWVKRHWSEIESLWPHTC